MKLRDNYIVKFEEIKEGEGFIFDFALYIKCEPSISSNGNVISNCVNLSTGEIYYLADEMLVEETELEVVRVREGKDE